MSQIACSDDDDLRTELRARVDRDGLAPAAKLLGLGREPLARFLAGLPVRPGTKAYLRERVVATRTP